MQGEDLVDIRKQIRWLEGKGIPPLISIPVYTVVLFCLPPLMIAAVIFGMKYFLYVVVALLPLIGLAAVIIFLPAFLVVFIGIVVALLFLHGDPILAIVFGVLGVAGMRIVFGFGRAGSSDEANNIPQPTGLDTNQQEAFWRGMESARERRFSGENPPGQGL